jgi:hypothetical protein
MTLVALAQLLFSLFCLRRERSRRSRLAARGRPIPQRSLSSPGA